MSAPVLLDNVLIRELMRVLSVSPFHKQRGAPQRKIKYEI